MMGWLEGGRNIGEKGLKVGRMEIRNRDNMKDGRNGGEKEGREVTSMEGRKEGRMKDI